MSHNWHAASSFRHDSASGMLVVVMGASLHHPLIAAIHDMMYPTMMCSGANCSSQAVGTASNNARDAGMGLSTGSLEVLMAVTEVGEETHDGGRSSESYPGSGADN